MSAFWTGQCTTCFHQNPKTNSWFAEKTKCSANNLFRRYIIDGLHHRNTDTSCGTDSGSVRTVGICGKLSEIPTEPSPIARVSGHYDKFCNASNQSAQRQSKEHPKGMSESHRALPK